MPRTESRVFPARLQNFFIPHEFLYASPHNEEDEHEALRMYGKKKSVHCSLRSTLGKLKLRQKYLVPSIDNHKIDWNGLTDHFNTKRIGDTLRYFLPSKLCLRTLAARLLTKIWTLEEIYRNFGLHIFLRSRRGPSQLDKDCGIYNSKRQE